MKKYLYKNSYEEFKMPLFKSRKFFYLSVFMLVCVSSTKLLAQGEEIVNNLPEMTVTASFEGELDESTMGDWTYSQPDSFAPDNGIVTDLTYMPVIDWLSTSYQGNTLNVNEFNSQTGPLKNLIDNSGIKSVAPKTKTNKDGSKTTTCGMAIDNTKGKSVSCFSMKDVVMDAECVGCDANKEGSKPGEVKSGDAGNLKLSFGTAEIGKVGYIINREYDKFGEVTYDYEEKDGNFFHAKINPVSAGGTFSYGNTFDGVKSTLSLDMNTDGKDFITATKISYSGEATFDNSPVKAKFELTYEPNKSDQGENLGETVAVKFTLSGFAL